MKVKRFVIVKGYKIVDLEEKINILEKEITTKNQRIDFLETKNAELIVELSQNGRNRGHTMTNFEQKYLLQIKERRIVKGCYSRDELPFVSDCWVDNIISFDLENLQSMIEKSTCKSDYRIVTYPQMEVVK